MDTVSTGTLVFLGVTLCMALAFEFVNGFHDTANAVATVIYTNSLRPWVAVVWSGLWNLLGVLTSTGMVAFGILALLPVELVINAGSHAGFTMVLALLLSAITWNLGTWALGLPASSSHALIGSIMGVGMVNSLMAKGNAFGDGVNWGKAKDVFLSLLVSPMVGFVLSALLLLVFKLLLARQAALFRAPPPGEKPPPWIRGLLVLTCTGVSFAHGSNDGQKGMGLIMLILIGCLPGVYALNMALGPEHLAKIQDSTQAIERQLDAHQPQAHTLTLTTAEATDELSSYLKVHGAASDRTYAALRTVNAEIHHLLEGKTSFTQLSEAERRQARLDLYLAGDTAGKLVKQAKVTDAEEKQTFSTYKALLEHVTKFIPLWVKIAVACALGFGTMIGWKRIVVTVGEKIGKSHLTYGQGAAAELVAMGTILAADRYGLPVSTTHVLSSGVAGTMVANGSGLQAKTLLSIVLAWVLTLPVCVILGSGLFGAGLFLVLTLIKG